MGKTGQPYAEETVLHLTQKLTQQINGLNIKTETIKFLDENIGSKLLDIGLSDKFFEVDTQKQKKKNRTSGTISLKSFCTAERKGSTKCKGSLWNRRNIQVNIQSTYRTHTTAKNKNP